MFESNSDYCDNARAVYDYLIKHNYDKEYQFVWCVKDVTAFRQKNFRNTKFVSFSNPMSILPYFYHMATSKYILYTHFVPLFMNPKCQTVVNLWHGTPLKSIKSHVHSAELFTYVLSPSHGFDAVIMESFEAQNAQLLHCGYPRNDLLFEENDALMKLQIDKDSYQHVILWMPTFRRPVDGSYQDGDVTQTGLPMISSPQELVVLNQKLLENNQFMIIKLHPAQDMSNVDLVEISNIKMLTSWNLDQSEVQLYHLVNQCDVLLTDYSSIYFDFLLLDRPIGFIIDDMDQYNAKRGFVTQDPLDIMPGEKMKTIEELHSFLKNLSVGQDVYQEDRARVNQLVNEYQDNQSASRVLKTIGIDQ